jgi:predicted outer membrane repeat protein
MHVWLHNDSVLVFIVLLYKDSSVKRMYADFSVASTIAFHILQLCKPDNCMLFFIHIYRYGGAVLSVANTFVTFKDCYFLQNYAIEEGGSIFGFPGSNYTVENSVFRGNSARYGGAITAKGSLQVSDSYFTEQVARFTGGAINTAAGSNAVILNSDFAYNKVSISVLDISQFKC